MIVKLIGWLASREPVMALLFKLAEEYEGGHLFDEQGEAYMGRWSLIAKGSAVSRWLSRLTRGKYDHARIHWIAKSDGDREVHDHPFNYRTFVMDGWYVEHYIPFARFPLMNGPALRQWQGSSRRLPDHAAQDATLIRVMGKGKSAAAPVGQFHRIARVSDGGVWTLFFMGPDTGKWGFLVDGRWMRSHDFFKLKRIDRSGVAL
jgi:hypothetical protein